jgi:diguanylate cyclase (GGDEF)-like protein/PAS domain S-box-containing protein
MMFRTFEKGFLAQWVLLAVGLVLLGGAVAHNLYKIHRDIMMGERHRLQTQARVVSDNLTVQIAAADRVIKALCSELSGRDPDTWQAVIEQKQMRLFQDVLPGIRVLNAIDADGAIRLSNRDDLLGRSMAQREYFIHARKHHDQQTLFVSSPFQTLLGAWGVNLVRVMPNADGGFGGIISATLNPDYFQTLLRSVNYSQDMVTAIIHGDGLIFTMEPNRVDLSGKNLNLPGTFFSQHRASGNQENLFSGTLYATNDQRLMVFKTFQPELLQLDKPLLVLAARRLDAIKADWRTHARYQTATFLTIALISILALLLYQRRQRQLLQQAEAVSDHLRKLQLGVENSASGVLITDVNGTIEYVNRKFTQVTGYSPDEAIGHNPRILKSESTPREVFQELWSTILRGEEWHGELLNRRKNGEVYWSAASISPLHNEAGQITHFIANVEDINERKNAEATIERLAYFDPLTDLPNRRMLQDRLEQGLKRSRRQNNGMALLYIDLDRFKQVNDSLGHPAGDRLLKELARRLVAALRDDDVVCRLGGDEFAVILHDIHHEEDVLPVVNKLLRTVEQPVVLEEGELFISASIGVSLYPKDGEDTKTLEKHADMALYHAKEEGKNTFRFFREELNYGVQERIAFDQGLRHALGRHELRLHYQPKIALATGRVVGVEALLRWVSNDFGMVAPDRFIPLAEENRLIVPIGEWVLRTACQQQVAWQQQGLELSVAVNLSAVQLKTPDLIERIAAVMTETNIRPDQLELELTESALVEQPDQVVRVLERLRGLGCGISIDDFGTGYSSLSYLKAFPVSVLKIDRSFVQDLTYDSGDRAIAQSVVNMADNLGMQTVAEGVETPEQQEILKQIGCTFVQGFMYAKPVPAEQIPDVVATIEASAS